MLTTLWAFPVTRIIDILKIPPARRLEKLPRGWGVLADDLLGSLYAAAVLYLLYALSNCSFDAFSIQPTIMGFPTH